MSKVDELKSRLFAVEILKLFKKFYTHEELYKIFGFPPSVLSRYKKGRILPNIQKAKKIISFFKEKHLVEIVKSGISKKGDVYDLTALHYDTNLQRLISKVVFNEFEHVKVDKILTAAASGIPLAIQVGNEFDVKVVIAKDNKELGVENFLEEKAVFSPALFKTLYIPKGSIQAKEHVLIVDDLTRTGTTLEALIRLVEKSKAKVSGIFIAVSIGNNIERLVKKLKLSCKVTSLVNF